MDIAYLILQLHKRKAAAFEESTKDPLKAQEAVLLEYIRRNKDTEYGKKYSFGSIRSIEMYQKIVPMSDSESVYPYIERMKKGETNVITADKPVLFGLTSGTTSHQKFIPVTKYSRAKKAEVANLWAYYISRDHPAILDGKILAIISPEVDGITECGIPYGAESGHGYRNLPWAVRRLYAIPAAVFDIKDYSARYYCMLRIGMGENVTTIATLNPSTLVLMSQKADTWKDLIIDDIEKGSLSDSFDIPRHVRRALVRELRPDPRRAALLRDIARTHGKLMPKHFWPKLVLIECWKGGPVKLYLKELSKYFGDVPVRDFGCLSTEARSSIPMSDKGAGGVLAINTNFYEFVPVSDISKSDKAFLLCDQLEIGKNYYLILTTPGGLYRYNIDDVITVDGYFNKTPIIEFVQKGLSAVSVMGEKVYESHISEAVNKAADKHNLLIKFISACVQMDSPPRYIFLVEFDQALAENEAGMFLKSIEEEMYRQNDEYYDLRKRGLLNPPIMKIVANGNFEKYRMMKIRQGAHDGQFKVPELTSDENFPKNFVIEKEIGIT